jgi:hypothetical protein
MKLSNVFAILAVTSLAILAKASGNDVGEEHDVARRLRGAEGTRHLKKKKKKKKLTTKVFDVRLPVNKRTVLFKHGPMEVVAQCRPGAVLFLVVDVTNGSTEDLGVFGLEYGQGYSDVIKVGDGPISRTLMYVIGTGNHPGNGAISTSTGFYVSVDGETAIALSAGGLALDPAYGAEIACVFVGSISMGKHNAWKGTIETLYE